MIWIFVNRDFGIVHDMFDKIETTYNFLDKIDLILENDKYKNLQLKQIWPRPVIKQIRSHYVQLKVDIQAVRYNLN